jgi:hypothetical protein
MRPSDRQGEIAEPFPNPSCTSIGFFSKALAGLEQHMLAQSLETQKVELEVRITKKIIQMFTLPSMNFSRISRPFQVKLKLT